MSATITKTLCEEVQQGRIFYCGFCFGFYFHNKHGEHLLKRLKGSRDFYFNKKVRNCWRLKESSGNVGTTLLLAFLPL